MCLLIAAFNAVPGYRLIIAANRDEFHARPAAAAEWWEDAPHILGGRDLEALGTWLACDRHGRFATITNVRDPHSATSQPRSRGLIISDYLGQSVSAAKYCAALADKGHQYAGFNVLAADASSLCWYSNHDAQPQTLDAGIYTLSNASLHTPWPKTERLRAGFQKVVEQQPADLSAPLMELLGDNLRADDHDLPQTGIPLAQERALSSIFIRGEHYGTRCSTVLAVSDSGHAQFHERRYDPSGERTGETLKSFELATAGT